MNTRILVLNPSVSDTELQGPIEDEDGDLSNNNGEDDDDGKRSATEAGLLSLLVSHYPRSLSFVFASLYFIALSSHLLTRVVYPHL